MGYKALLITPVFLLMANCGGGSEESSTVTSAPPGAGPGSEIPKERSVGMRSADDYSNYLGSVIGVNPRLEDQASYNNYKSALSTGTGISETNIKAAMDVALRACNTGLDRKSTFFPSGINLTGNLSQFSEGLTYAIAWHTLARARGANPGAELVQASVTSFNEIKSAVAADTTIAANLKSRRAVQLHCAATLASSLAGIARIN